MDASKDGQHWTRRLDWTDIVFFVLTPIAAIVLIPLYWNFFGFHWDLIVLAVLYGSATMMSVTAGYHRMIAHKSFRAKTWLKFVYLIIGAGAFQGPALKWCSDHRRHHRHVDTPLDPYSISRGFFYAHVGWLFLKENTTHTNFDRDLAEDKLIAWQYKNYVVIASAMAFVFPAILGGLIEGNWGGVVGGLLIAGLGRLVLTHHMAFLTNSACHTFGTQPFGDKNSARDSFWLALLTYGEGYHNFHHNFASDYRNGVKWYAWDPTKWHIRLMEIFGATYNLRRCFVSS